MTTASHSFDPWFVHVHVCVTWRVVNNALCVCVGLQSAPLILRCFYCQLRFLLLFSRQGKLRLQKWFTPMPEREKKKIVRDMTTMVLARQPRSCNFLHWKDLKIIYKRWVLFVSPLASLYFLYSLGLPVSFSTDGHTYCLLNMIYSHQYQFIIPFSSDMQACISAWA